MQIAINPEAPEYVARITLKPKEMKIQNRYQHVEGKFAGNMIVLLWAAIVVSALTGII